MPIYILGQPEWILFWSHMQTEILGFIRKSIIVKLTRGYSGSVYCFVPSNFLLIRKIRLIVLLSQWCVITHPRHSWRIGHGWIIISQVKHWIWLCIDGQIPTTIPVDLLFKLRTWNRGLFTLFSAGIRTWMSNYKPTSNNRCNQSSMSSQIAKFMGTTWDPPGSCRPQMGPMLVQWTLLSVAPFTNMD